MKILCLFVQRKCSYEGQYAPELFAAIDEYGNDDNPDYLIDEEAKAKDDSSITFIKRMTINVPNDDFDRLFYDKEELKGSPETQP